MSLRTNRDYKKTKQRLKKRRLARIIAKNYARSLIEREAAIKTNENTQG